MVEQVINRTSGNHSGELTLLSSWPGSMHMGCGMHTGRTSIVLDTNAEKMLGLSLELIFVALLWAQGGYAQNLSALLTPLAFNASQGSETTFHCSVTGADTLFWIVDNALLLPVGVNNNRGIMVTQPVAVAGISGSFQSNLTIQATPENDGSVVQCVAAMIPGSNVLSHIASYHVQGSVVALVSSYILHDAGTIFLCRYTGSPH